MAWPRFAASHLTRPLLAAVLCVGLAGTAAAQWPPQQGSQQQMLPPPGGGGAGGGGAQRNPTCMRLEGQLASLDRGPGAERADQIQRYEDAANRQQQELDRMNAQAQRMGCGGGGFFLFGGQPAQCSQVNEQIQRMRVNLDRIHAGLRELRGSGGGDREDQRRAILAALSQNDCGPQYRTATANPSGGFFEQLFGGTAATSTPETAPSYQTSTYRTLCVRTCDGYFFPISFSTGPDRFEDDARACQRMCPAAEAVLFTHRNPGEEIAQAVSAYGEPYSKLPNAFRYRKEFDASCTCQQPGRNWTDAIADDDTLEQGDIVVNEDRARTLSQPRAPRQQGGQAGAQGRGGATGTAAAAAQPGAGSPAQPAETTPPARSVGPQFLR